MLKIYTTPILLLTIFSLFCAEEKKEITITYALPKEISANIAEFMPANSKFVDYMARVYKLSDEKYFEIGEALIFGEIGKFSKITNLEFLHSILSDSNNSEAFFASLYPKIKITYDYEDIENLLNKYFNTTPNQAAKIDNTFLKQKMRDVLQFYLSIFPVIAFKHYLIKSDMENMRKVMLQQLNLCLLFDQPLLNGNNIDMSSYSVEEIKNIYGHFINETLFIRSVVAGILSKQLINPPDDIDKFFMFKLVPLIDAIGKKLNERMIELKIISRT